VIARFLLLITIVCAASAALADWGNYCAGGSPPRCPKYACCKQMGTGSVGIGLGDPKDGDGEGWNWTGDPVMLGDLNTIERVLCDAPRLMSI
jgi:hypothetical protein